MSRWQTALAGAFVLALGLPGPAAAQLEAALDLGYDHAHVWRGLTRVERSTLQPALTLAWKQPRWMLSAGGWALLEPWDPDADELTIAGPGETLGELDYWAQLDYRITLFDMVLDLRGGWTAYTYHGEGGGLGLDDSFDTSELYLGFRMLNLAQLYTILGLPPDLPFGFEAMAAFDLDEVGGTYLEGGLVADLPLLFIGEPLGGVIARLTSGWSIAQDIDPAEPLAGRYDDNGLTHLALSLGITPLVRPAGIPLAVDIAGTVQLNTDDATRRRGFAAGDEASVVAWIDLTTSLLLPLRRRP